MPTKEPAPLADYSIGEEISASAPIAIAWSPPGLAKHRRCALAALTANLVLSIWSAEGRPQEGSSWDRRLIVNNALAEYFLSTATDEPGHVAPSFCERMRLRTRIRSFTWAPSLPNLHPSSTLGSRLSYGQHIVAVCNDDNQLALVVIASPTSTYGADQGWSAKVLTHTSVMPESESIFPAPSFFDDTIKQQKYISHVSWSPWVIRDDRCYSIIVYATNEDVRARVVMYTNDRIDIGDETVYPHIEMRYNGPMKWCSTVHDDTLTLALFTAFGLVQLEISTHDASIVKRAVHDLDGRWDQVSGAIWDSAHGPTPRLHFSSLLSTIHTPTAVLEASSTGLKALGHPSWRDQVENSAVLFSAKNDLKGNSKMKVWGLATSPLGDFIATCHSVHPSDMIEYGSPNDRRGTVAVSALRQYRQMRESFPAQDVSAEGVLFTLKKLVENTVEDSDQMPAFVEEIARKLVHTYGALDRSGDSSSVSPSRLNVDHLDELVKVFKQIAFFDPRTLKDRYTVLASYACNTKSTSGLERTLIAYRLAIALQYLPKSLSEAPFSSEVRIHHRKMMALIRKLIEPEAPQTATMQSSDDETLLDHAESDFAAFLPTQPANALADGVELELAEATVDICDFCSAPIPFTDPTTASCTNGHQFPRCGLSFLALQAPGITKYCGICSTPFLSEEFVTAQEMKERPVGVTEQSNTNRGDNVLLDDRAITQVPANDDRLSNFDDEEVISTGINPPREDHDQRNGRQDRQRVLESVDESAIEDARIEPSVTLARVLFLACDACIYCGGKFVG